MNKILVPYDFSDIALHALNFAADLAQKQSTCSVTLINVIEQPSPETFSSIGVYDYDPMENLYIKKLIDTSKEKMEALMAEAKYKSIDLKYKIVLGNPFREMGEEIATQQVDLVVMGTSGASGAEEFLVGSNAERMVRYSKCPVITVNRKVDAASIKEIVCASNFNEVTDSMVEHIKKLQSVFNAHLKFVKINTPASFTTSRHDKKQMEEFIKKYGFESASYETYNFSNEEEGIVAYAEDVNADLIAIGTHQRKGVGHFFSGSIAEDVVNHSKVPVWTFGLK